MSFSVAIFREVIENLGNNYSDNWDTVRFGPEMKISAKMRLKRFISDRLFSMGLFRANDIRQALYNLNKEAHYFEYLYSILQNKESKDLLIKVLAYRALGHRKVKLPHNTPDYWSRLASLDQLADKNDVVDSRFSNFILHKFNLEKIGYPIHLYFTSLGIMIDFITKQYEYHAPGVSITVEPDDVVIDGGGCWGDTALFFAHAAGDGGKVYSFEFIPFNLELLRKNTSINPSFLPIIEVVEHPLWSNTSTKVFYKDNGPASKVKMEQFDDHSGTTTTISIDHFAEQKKLDKLDFIKLDIEGAELTALRGAVNSLRSFKPKIAVALYHYSHDFETIPRFINELDLGYKFYLSHCTINREETILFATVDK